MLSLEVAIYILKKKLYMFWMKSNGESDENILYLLTTYIAEAFLLDFTSGGVFHNIVGDDLRPSLCDISHYSYIYITFPRILYLTFIALYHHCCSA
jgi:hypothetical protein